MLKMPEFVINNNNKLDNDDIYEELSKFFYQKVKEKFSEKRENNERKEKNYEIS